MPEKLELITQASKQPYCKSTQSPYANKPDRGRLFNESKAEIIPVIEIKTTKERIKSAGLIIAENINKVPWTEIGQTGKDVSVFVLIRAGQLAVFILKDVVPFVFVNGFKVVRFFVQLIVFFVKDIISEFKKDKVVQADKDTRTGSGQSSVYINDNHGTINIIQNS